MLSKTGVMNDYYRHLDKKSLSWDDRLHIIKVEAMAYCEQNRIDYIRYTKLKDLCDNKLAELTGEVFGGNFDILLNKLWNPPRRNDKHFFKRVEVGHKETRLYPNIELIKADHLKHIVPNTEGEYVTVHRGLDPEVFKIGDYVEPPKVITKSERDRLQRIPHCAICGQEVDMNMALTRIQD